MATSSSLSGSDRPDDGRARGAIRSGALPLVAACVAAVLFYAGPYDARGLTAPVADDSFFYVGAIRRAGALGLADPHLKARPGYPLVASALGSVFRASPWNSATTLPVAAALGLGLVGAAIARRWGVRSWGAGLFALLVSLSELAARLVAGKSENLFAVWLLAAVVAVALAGSGGRAAAAAGILVFGAGLAEWPMVLAFLIILGVALATERFRLGHRHSDSSGVLSLRTVLVAGLAGAAAVAVVVFAWNGTTPADAIQRLPPSFRYSVRLHEELAFTWPALTLPLFMVGWWAARRWGRPALAGIRWLLDVWAVLTGVVLLAGLDGARLPTYRALTLGVPVALGVAAAPLVPAVRGGHRGGSDRGGSKRWAGAAGGGAAVLALLALVPATALWYRDLTPKTNARELEEIVRAGRYTSSLPGHEPAVLVVDRVSPVAGYFYQRVAYAVLPSAENGRLVIFSGRSSDAMAGRPTLRGDPSFDDVSRALFGSARTPLAEGAPILAARALDPEGFAAATSAGRPTIGGDVAVVRGASPPAGLRVSVRPNFLPPWWLMAIEAVGMLALLAAAGIGWVELAAPEADLVARWSLAPPVGVVTLGIIALVIDRAGLHPGGWGGVVAVLVAVAGGGAVLAWSRLRPSAPPAIGPASEASARAGRI